MFARVTAVQARPDRIEEAVRDVREWVVPTLRCHAGFRDPDLPVDRQGGKLRGFTLRQAEEAPRATEERPGSCGRAPPRGRPPKSYPGVGHRPSSTRDGLASRPLGVPRPNEWLWSWSSSPTAKRYQGSLDEVRE